MPFSRTQIAQRAALDIPPGSIVNLGIGLPTLVADFVPQEREVWFQSENGLLGMGPFPYEGDEDPQLINAGKQTVTVVDGGSTFDSATSFSMIRGGHVDLAILGAMQVSQHGDLANWAIPNGRVMGVGGAMDLASGARNILVLMTHTTRKGLPKLVADCSYPLTAARSVNRVITDLAVLDIVPDLGFRLVECAPDTSIDDVRSATDAEIHID